MEGESLTREEFALKAIRLSRLLYELLPHSNCGGLLALLLLHDARREARNKMRNRRVMRLHTPRQTHKSKFYSLNAYLSEKYSWLQ